MISLLSTSGPLVRDCVNDEIEGSTGVAEVTVGTRGVTLILGWAVSTMLDDDDNGTDDMREDTNDDDDKLAPGLTLWICDVFITAETANLALSESRVNREVGCEEKECSKLFVEMSSSEVSCFRSCSCWARCICSSCSRWDWKLSRLNSVLSSWDDVRGSCRNLSSAVGEWGRKWGLK